MKNCKNLLTLHLSLFFKKFLMSYSESLYFNFWWFRASLVDYIILFFKKVSFFDKPDYNNFSDVEIIRKILNWKKDLFEVIVNRYSDKIFRYLYYQFGFQKSVAIELVQEVFLKVWQKLDSFDVSKKFENRIFTIAHNLAIDRIKKNGAVDPVELNDNEIKDSIDFNENWELEYKRKLLERLIGQLDFRYREVLILYYFEWKSYDEIADILGTTKNTVWSWIKRAKDKLKEIIEKDPILKQALEI